jgi:outer membrane protein
MGEYFNVQFYKGLLEIANKQKELSELNLKRAKSRFAAGLDAKSDLAEMESKLASEELFLVQTQNNLSAAILSLKQTMNYTETEDFATDDYKGFPTIDLGAEPAITTVFNQALKQNPWIKATELQRSAAKKYLATAKGELFPSLSLSGGYSTNYAKASGDNEVMSLRDQFKSNASQSISLSLDIPIFYKWSIHSNIKKAKLQLKQAQTDFDLTKQQLYQEIEKNFNELSALSAEYDQTLRKSEFSGIAYKAAEKKLETGLIDILDFYETKNQMAQSESEVLRTKLQYELKRRTIDFFIGNPIYSE